MISGSVPPSLIKAVNLRTKYGDAKLRHAAMKPRRTWKITLLRKDRKVALKSAFLSPYALYSL